DERCQGLRLHHGRPGGRLRRRGDLAVAGADLPRLPRARQAAAGRLQARGDAARADATRRAVPLEREEDALQHALRAAPVVIGRGLAAPGRPAGPAGSAAGLTAKPTFLPRTFLLGALRGRSVGFAAGPGADSARAARAPRAPRRA